VPVTKLEAIVTKASDIYPILAIKAKIFHLYIQKKLKYVTKIKKIDVIL
jgi:hypothetical protein